MLRIDGVKVFEDLNEEALFKLALKKSRVNNADVLNIEIAKKSIDARDKNNVHYLYSFNIEVKDENKYSKLKHIELVKELSFIKNRTSSLNPIIIGAGPAGLFAAITLVDHGYKPIIIEQGESVEKREEIVNEYLEKGILNPKCNVQFGEGGAGTFSDGKLTTGINSTYINSVLKTFYKYGGPKEITYLAHPHIGTDNLVKILKNIRKHIEEKGGVYHFNECFIDYKENGKTIEVITDKGNYVTDALVLAIGHSARNTYKLLKAKNVDLEKKNFSVGVRVEHLQSMINLSQYGDKTKLNLPPAEYKLWLTNAKRPCYSFCMCPGGEVIASSSEEGHIVTNGMSRFKRDGKNANAALLVNVNVEDLKDEDVLAGMYFQEELEVKAYEVGKGKAPCQRYEDFKNNVPSTTYGKVEPTYKPGVTFTNLNEVLPDFVSDALKEGIDTFGRKIKGFDDPDTLLTGVETRTSAPITIKRDKELLSYNKYIYPCGEGAGYAGGITSAAIDGIKVAKAIIERKN